MRDDSECVIVNMVPLQLLATVLMQAKHAPLTAIESEALSQAKCQGAEEAWVTENGKEVLCLDYTNPKVKVNFESVGKLKPLYALRLLGNDVKFGSLSPLRALPSLGLLVIMGKGVNDDDLKEIGQMKRLDKLDIRGDSITVSGLKQIQNLKKLRRLFLYGSKIKDSDLSAFEPMTWLEQLDLPPTVSQARVEALKAKLPKCIVSRWDGKD